MRFHLVPKIFLPTNRENIITFGFLMVHLCFDAVKNLCLTWPSVGCLYTWFLPIWGSASADSTSWGSCSAIVFTIEKDPRISGLMQLKPLLFKDQLYILSVHTLRTTVISFIIVLGECRGGINYSGEVGKLALKNTLLDCILEVIILEGE